MLALPQARMRLVVEAVDMGVTAVMADIQEARRTEELAVLHIMMLL